MAQKLDVKFVKKGMSEPREGLRDEGVVHIGLGRKYEAELGAFGWPKEKTDAIQDDVDSLGTKIAEQAEAKVSAKAATSTEAAARAEAKAYIGKVRLGAEILIRGGEVTDVSLESFEAGGKLGNSTPRVAMYLEKIRPHVAALDEQLKIYFNSEKPSAILDALKQNLDNAQADQEVSSTSLPQDTQAVYEVKGRLLTRIEEMNRVARIVFYEQSEIAGQFNKDVLRRGRKSRGSKTAE